MSDEKKLPTYIEVVEVGPRDGFQNLQSFIPTPIKIKIIRKMIMSGIKAMELTSFVHPGAIPQMADAAEVVRLIHRDYPDKGFRSIALVPNLFGAKKAHAAGIREVTYVISASEKHNLANINRTHEQSFADLRTIIAELPELEIRLDIATAFGCPFQGPVGLDLVKGMIDRALCLGAKKMILCDTIGVANPTQVQQIVVDVQSSFPGLPLGLHLHDTRGMGLANVLAGLEGGVTTFESSVGGLGGCPFAPGAAGNIATEDLVNMVHAMGIKTGIDLEKYMQAVQSVKEEIQTNLSSHMAYAKQYEGIS